MYQRPEELDFSPGPTNQFTQIASLLWALFLKNKSSARRFKASSVRCFVVQFTPVRNPDHREQSAKGKLKCDEALGFPKHRYS